MRTLQFAGYQFAGEQFDGLEFNDGGAPASFVISPSTIPKNHSGNITLTLTGTGTHWNGTTVFTLSGVSGAVKVSQSIISSTSASVTITTGSGTGTLTITESVTGTSSADVTVATATLVISGTSGNTGTTPTLTLTGTNTLWSSEVASTLFSASGSSSLGTPTITTDTDGSVVLTVPLTETSNVIITDNSTGATATWTLAAATNFGISGPSSAVLNVPIIIKVKPNGTTSVTFTPHTTGTGNFAPSSLVANGADYDSFVYTPTDYTDSPHTITVTDSGALTDPSGLVITISQFDLSTDNEDLGIYDELGVGL